MTDTLRYKTDTCRFTNDGRIRAHAEECDLAATVRPLGVSA
jgi:hypothetical protein